MRAVGPASFSSSGREFGGRSAAGRLLCVLLVAWSCLSEGFVAPPTGLRAAGGVKRDVQAASRARPNFARQTIIMMPSQAPMVRP